MSGRLAPKTAAHKKNDNTRTELQHIRGRWVLPGQRGRSVSGRQRNQASVAQAVQGQTVAAVNTGFLEDVLQVDLDGTRLNSKLRRDFPVLKAQLNQLHDLLFAGGKSRTWIARGAAAVAKHAVFHPCAPGGDSPQAGDHVVRLRALAENRAR